MKTTSLELSKQLKEAGATANTEFGFYSDGGSGRRLLRRDESWNYAVGEFICPVFDCHELLERLPYKAKSEDGEGWLRVRKVMGGFYANYYDKQGCSVAHGHIELHPDKNPAEALGKLYLWCLQNGHCEENGEKP